MNEIENKVVKNIRADYEAKTEKQQSIEKLLALDSKVKNPALIFALVFGIIASLILGTGMSLAMKVIGDAMVVGIIVGVVGIIMAAVNYPIYKSILTSRKNKYASQVLELSNAILEETK